MGFAACFGVCFICNLPFGFNPIRVPSMRDAHGARQPICKACMDEINRRRTLKGINTFAYSEDAYEACNEEEL